MDNRPAAGLAGFIHRHWVLLLVLVLLIAIAGRVFGASDVHLRDQSRTMSYTIDMVENGNWLLPADPAGLPTTKPLLINVMQVPFVAVFGPRPWAFKLPSLIALLLTVWLLAHVSRTTFARFADETMTFGLGQRTWALALTIAFYVLSAMQLRLSWLARPDMLLVFFMTLGWWAAVRSLDLQQRAGWWVPTFWLAIVGAAVTKGPLALLVLAYPVLSVIVIQRDWRALSVLRAHLYLVPVLVASLAWPILLWFFHREHLVYILLSREVGSRFGGGWYEGLKTSWEVLGYVVSRSLPYTIFLFPFLYFFPWRRFRAHPLAPMMIYSAMIIALLAVMSLRRGDQFGPLYPAIAVLLGWVCVYARPRDFWLKVYAASLPITALGLASYYAFLSEEVEAGWGDNAVAFTRDVRAATAGEKIAFCPYDTLGVPIEPLTGTNERGLLKSRAGPEGAWVVTQDPPAGVEPDVRSGPIWYHRFALYRAGPNEAICRNSYGF
ncbi:ArnT family glycosyltransferase [Tepidamorphus sp. 3E244]|uniref:ArnT family glycosyltransferase n=1 Tax=Tepidamorphus sp. 3E244 TaxID=3385498 RepID=UPI0038FC5663